MERRISMKEQMTKQIIEYALQGYTNEKIAELMDIEVYEIRDIMAQIRETMPNEYNEILMVRALRGKILDKDIFEYLEKGILARKTFLELSYGLEQSKEYTQSDGSPILLKEGEIKQFLKDFLHDSYPYKDEEYYEKLKTKLEENERLYGFAKFKEFMKQGIDPTRYLNPNTVRNYQSQIKKMKLVQEIKSIPNETSILAIAKQYGLVSSTVKEVLTGKDKDHLLQAYYGEEEAKKIADSYQTRIQEIKKDQVKRSSMGFPSYDKPYISEQDANIIKFIRENQEMILKLILQYHLTSDKLAELLHFQNKDILVNEILTLAELNENGKNLKGAIKYAMYNYYQDLYHNNKLASQKEQENFMKAASFFQKYLKALKEDKEEEKRLFAILNDEEYKKVLRKREPFFAKLSKEDQRVVIEYRIKYLLPYRQMPYTHTVLSSNVPQDLLKEWHLVNQYNIDRNINEYKSRIPAR